MCFLYWRSVGRIAEGNGSAADCHWQTWLWIQWWQPSTDLEDSCIRHCKNCWHFGAWRQILPSWVLLWRCILLGSCTLHPRENCWHCNVGSCWLLLVEGKKSSVSDFSEESSCILLDLDFLCNEQQQRIWFSSFCKLFVVHSVTHLFSAKILRSCSKVWAAPTRENSMSWDPISLWGMGLTGHCRLTTDCHVQCHHTKDKKVFWSGAESALLDGASVCEDLHSARNQDSKMGTKCEENSITCWPHPSVTQLRIRPYDQVLSWFVSVCVPALMKIWCCKTFQLSPQKVCISLLLDLNLESHKQHFTGINLMSISNS